VKRYSFVWWAIIGVAIAIMLRDILPPLPFFYNYLQSDFADSNPMFGRQIFLYISVIAYALLKISIGNALRPKSIKNN